MPRRERLQVAGVPVHIIQRGNPILRGVNRDSSRSNVRLPGVSRTIIHQELAEVIGTGFVGRDSTPPSLPRPPGAGRALVPATTSGGVLTKC